MGLDAIQSRLEGLLAAAAVEVLAVVPGGAQPVYSLFTPRSLDEDLAARGLVIRTLYQDGMRGDRTNLDYVRWLTDLGFQVRTAPLVQPRMILIDRQVAVVPIDPELTGLGIAVLRQPAVLAALTALFEQNWDAARDIEEPKADNRGEGITDRERELPKMPASGMTDEAAAKRLGVSLRTVKRRMEDLMRRLDAGSRFEAGMKAAQRGWLWTELPPTPEHPVAVWDSGLRRLPIPRPRVRDSPRET